MAWIMVSTNADAMRHARYHVGLFSGSMVSSDRKLLNFIGLVRENGRIRGMVFPGPEGTAHCFPIPRSGTSSRKPKTAPIPDMVRF